MATKYLLDTDACIFLLKDKANIKEKIEEVGIENCFVSEITIAELCFGAYNSAQLHRHLEDVLNIEKLFSIVPIYDCLHFFGKEKSRLRSEGNLIPDFDLLIGVTAIKYDMTLVTNNIKHLYRLEGIKIENWVAQN